MEPKCKRRGDWTRTSGLLLPKQVRYQLRYTPKLQPQVRSTSRRSRSRFPFPEMKPGPRPEIGKAVGEEAPANYSLMPV